MGDDAAQAFLKTKIMDNITKYYYLIVFTAYMREAADLAREAVADDKKADFTISGGKCAIPADQLKVAKSFQTFMADQPKLRTLIDEGKGDLQWERDIPPAALANLENLAKGDFKLTSAKSFMISTRQLTRCSWTCPRETTKRGPSIGLPLRPS